MEHGLPGLTRQGAIAERNPELVDPADHISAGRLRKMDGAGRLVDGQSAA